MRVLGKILNDAKNENGEDIHHIECASCHMKPLRGFDWYHCLLCSTSSKSYDLCGVCFEARSETGGHLNGHPIIHFKLPNEFLSIHVNNDLNNELTLNRIKTFNQLQNERHDGIICAGCDRTAFTGLRFQCYDCEQYDLCETCALQNYVCTKKHRRDHPLILASNNSILKIDLDDLDITKDDLGDGGFGKIIFCIKNFQDHIFFSFKVL